MKEKIEQWAQRNEPKVGTRIYWDGLAWSEKANGISIKSGIYLGNNEVEIDGGDE